MSAELSDRRSSDRAPRIFYDADTARLILELPEHRLQPGATVSYLGFDGHPRTLTLPADTQPGHVFRTRTPECHPWPRVIELVLLPQH